MLPETEGGLLPARLQLNYYLFSESRGGSEDIRFKKVFLDMGNVIKMTPEEKARQKIDKLLEMQKNERRKLFGYLRGG